MERKGPINPYVVGPEVRGEYGFYGRHDLIEEVVNTLVKTHQNAVVLHGPRRIGKSSLLYRILRDETVRLEYLPILTDFQMYEGRPLARILADLAYRIVNELKLDLPWLSEADLVSDFSRFQRTLLPEIYEHLGNKRLLFLFDEFDLAVPPDPSDPGTLLDYLRTLVMEESEHLAFVFVVGQRLDLLTEGYHRLFKAAYARRVGRMGQSETYELITELGQRGHIGYTDEALDKIWVLTNGHPFFTQLIGFEIFNRLQERGTQQVTVDDVTASLDGAMHHGQAALDWFWSGFTPEPQWVLSAVADLTDRQQSVSETEIEKNLQQHLVFLTPSALDKAYQDLLNGDFLVDTGQRRYRFAVELIRRWIVQRHPIQEAQRQIEAISPEALSYYQLGRRAFEMRNLDEAIKNYRQALEHNPHFVRVRLDLAVTLRLQENLPEAIDECEEAYRQDPESARDQLIAFRLTYVRTLERPAKDEAALLEAQRILELAPDCVEARQLISDIYLRQANAHLKLFQFEEAQARVQKLIQALSFSQDIGVAQRIRELWLDYSNKLIRQEPSNWNQAQRVLDSLDALGLSNETTRTIYNQVVLDKASALLERDMLDQALAVFQNELKFPLPTHDIQRELLDYVHRQVEHQRWIQPITAIERLHSLIGDRGVRPLYNELAQHTYDQFCQRLRLHRGTEGWEIYNDGEIMALWLETSDLFEDLNVPEAIPLLFLCKPDLKEDDGEKIRDLLSKDLHTISQASVVFLQSAIPSRLHKSQAILDEKIRRPYAHNITVLGPEDLERVMRAVEPFLEFRRAFLSQIDLITVSPFVVTGPTSDKMFFGREHEQRVIAEKARTASHVIIGGRRMGKTSILIRLWRVRLPATGFWALYHDCSTTPTSEDFLATTIRDWQPKPWPNAPVTFAELLRSPSIDRSLVVLLDESDKLIEADHADDWRLFGALRAMANSGRAQVVLSGERTLREALQDPASPLFNFANEMLLKPLEFHSVEELITRPMKQLDIGLVDEKAIVDRIWTFTSGHPNVVQRLCRRLIERLNEKRTRSITLDEVNAVIEDPWFQRDDFLSTYWEAATPLEKIISLLMADDESIRTLHTVRQTLAERCDLRPKARQVDDALQRLVDLRSILSRIPTGYEFAVEAFPRVVAGTMTLADMLEILTEEYREQGE